MRIDLQLFLNRWLCDDKTGKKFIPWSLFFANFAVRNMNFAIWKTHKLPMDNLRLLWLLEKLICKQIFIKKKYYSKIALSLNIISSSLIL